VKKLNWLSSEMGTNYFSSSDSTFLPKSPESNNFN
jgi:hypothetical protein